MRSSLFGGSLSLSRWGFPTSLPTSFWVAAAAGASRPVSGCGRKGKISSRFDSKLLRAASAQNISSVSQVARYFAARYSQLGDSLNLNKNTCEKAAIYRANKDVVSLIERASQLVKKEGILIVAINNNPA